MRRLLLILLASALPAADTLAERELWEESLRREKLGDAIGAAAVLAPLVTANDYLAHLRCGWLARYRRQWDEALAAYDRAQRLAPNSIEPLQGRLRAQVEGERWPDAERTARQLLILDPGDPSMVVWLALALEYQGRREEALRELDRAAERRPTDTSVQRARGRLLHALKRDGEARTAWRIVQRIEPGDAESLAGLAAIP